MHPPLDRPHPECGECIIALKKCHADNQYAKFWGACNDAKAELDWCFRQEKENKRKLNFDKAQAFDRAFNFDSNAGDPSKSKATGGKNEPK